MAASSRNRKKSSGFGWLLFWLAFLIVMTILFVSNREKIQASIAALTTIFNGAPAAVPAAKDPAAGPDGDQAASTETAAPARDGTVLTVTPPAASVETGPAAGTLPPAGITAPTGTMAPEGTAAPTGTTAPAGAAGGGKSVKRPVYLIRLDSDGALVASKVERTLPASDSPMQDALEAAIKGPSPDESKRKLLSLIPGRVRILSAQVQGDTAYVNFSEDFLFNTNGVEGYIGQLRQIVWTATEFSNVKKVQILIEGKRVDYLGEGLWIGSPISRNTL